MKVIQVVGARPNFMKVAPLHRAIQKLAGWTSKIVHTGQHFDAKMSDIFFTQLELDDAGEKIIIYDPWRQINPNFINLPSAIKTLNYFSLSHHAVIQN